MGAARLQGTELLTGIRSRIGRFAHLLCRAIGFAVFSEELLPEFTQSGKVCRGFGFGQSFLKARLPAQKLQLSLEEGSGQQGFNVERRRHPKIIGARPQMATRKST